jgi:hypothetical protein
MSFLKGLAAAGAAAVAAGGAALKKYLTTPHDVGEFQGRPIYHGTTSERMVEHKVGDSIQVRDYLFFTDNKSVAATYAQNAPSALRPYDSGGGKRVIYQIQTAPHQEYYKGFFGGWLTSESH